MCVCVCVCVCVRQRKTCLAIVKDLLSHSENKWEQDKASCHITNLSLLHNGWPQTSSEYPHLNIIKLYCLQTVDEVGIKLELDATGEPKDNGVRTNGRWCGCVGRDGGTARRGWVGGGGGTKRRERERKRENQGKQVGYMIIQKCRGPALSDRPLRCRLNENMK